MGLVVSALTFELSQESRFLMDTAPPTPPTSDNERTDEPQPNPNDGYRQVKRRHRDTFVCFSRSLTRTSWLTLYR